MIAMEGKLRPDLPAHQDLQGLGELGGKPDPGQIRFYVFKELGLLTGYLRNLREVKWLNVQEASP
jgi:hypothetical protein